MNSTKKVPRAPPRRRITERITTPSPAITPVITASSPPDVKAPARTLKARVCACEEVSESNIRQDNGQLVCIACGTIISDDVVVNDVTFREAPSGAVHVHGTTIHDGQRFAKTAGTSYRHAGRTPEDAQESSLRNAKEEMTRLANSLSISNVVERAFRLYTIARVHHFHRPVLDSVAICLYIVCRQIKGNTVLLIDFAEKIRQNVFDLGAVYKKFVRAIGLEDSLEEIPIIDIEPLLYRLAKRLEFGHYTRQVANDAALILSRMKRDWMVTGRQPPALCGAALVLAARMNNFRRSVREVVYVVKAGDATIQKRLREFRRTTAGQMTVSNFRSFSKRLKSSMDPPSVYLAKEAAERKAQATQNITGASSTSSAARVDADGFAIPSMPTPRPRGRPPKRRVEREQEEESNAGDDDASVRSSSPSLFVPPPKKRFRRSESHVPVFLTPDDLLAEDDLEKEINAVVASHTPAENAYDISLSRARVTAEAEKARHGARNVADSETIDADEFENDPEVANCLLDEEEIKIKEMIWVTANEDWLRSQQERSLTKAMEEAMGKKKKKARRGNGNTTSSAVADSPASTPAEASARMLEKRNLRPAFSRHIDYEKLKKIYRMSTGNEDDEDQSRQGSVAPSDISEQKAVAEEEVEEDEEVEEEDEEEEEVTKAGADNYVDDDDEEEYDEQVEEIDYDVIGIAEEEDAYFDD
jgi:transcription factor IIIB subunit 2